MLLSVYVKEDISGLIKDGGLDVKLDELDKLECAAKNNPKPAWLVSSLRASSVPLM